MNLIEPLGLVTGRAAVEAIDAGLAVPLAGGPSAFTLARLHGDGPPRIVPADAVPQAFAESLVRIMSRPAPWAGLPIDRPLVMGVVNVTSDSFSDGGDHLDVERAIAAGRRMAAQGADIVDVGGETTHPGSSSTDPGIEQSRIEPVVRALVEHGVVVSLDTRNASTMKVGLDAGARIINDVSGFGHDPAGIDLVRERGCPVVVMHMRGTPLTMQTLTDYDDVAVDVTRELGAMLERLGLPDGRVVVDPGIGFAKGPGHNESLLSRLPIFFNLGSNILVGASRKGFIGRIVLAAIAKDRLAGSLAASCTALLGGASILRVHDVAETVQSVRVWQAIRHAT